MISLLRGFSSKSPWCRVRQLVSRGRQVCRFSCLLFFSLPCAGPEVEGERNSRCRPQLSSFFFPKGSPGSLHTRSVLSSSLPSFAFFYSVFAFFLSVFQVFVCDPRAGGHVAVPADSPHPRGKKKKKRREKRWRRRSSRRRRRRQPRSNRRSALYLHLGTRLPQELPVCTQHAPLRATSSYSLPFLLLLACPRPRPP